MIAERFRTDLGTALPSARILTGEVDLATFSYDGALDRHRPDAVALVRTAAEAQAVVKACAAHKVPFVCRGAGTNLSGGVIPLRGGVILSTALMTRILSIDTARRVACVEPGLVNMDLQKALEPLGFFYAPDPASFKVCSIGGNVAENAGGPRCLKYGVTSNHVLAVEVVTPDGELRKFSAEEAGPDLCALMVGSEGTLGVVTKVWVRLTPIPESITTLLAAFDSVDAAIACVSRIMAAGILPRTLEAMDKITIDAVEDFLHCGYPRGAEAVLLIELDGAAARVAVEAKAVEGLCREGGTLEFRAAKDAAERDRLWEGRRGAYAAMARLAPNVLVEDGVVPRSMLPEAVRRAKEIAAREGVTVSMLFHAGDGNLHPNMIFDERDPDQTARVKRAGFEILQVCVELGGSLSGEHGIGADKRQAMAWLFSAETLELFRRVKAALDPDDLANPDKVIPLKGEGGEDRKFRRPERIFGEPARFLIEEVRRRVSAGESFTVTGAGTHIGAIGPRAPGGFVSTKPLDQVLDLDNGNYVVTAEAGVPVAALLKAAAAKGLRLPLPAWPGTLGGLLATRPWPGLRDHILGMRVLLGNGDVIELGGKTVKNVAGYDLQRLLLGSWGGYGIILDATLKAYSAPVELPQELPAPLPFKPSDWHRRLKKAFDPDGHLNPWLFTVSGVERFS